MTTIHFRRRISAVFCLVQGCFSRRVCSILSAVACLLLFSLYVQAQTAHFGDALSTLGSGFSQPTAAAVDPSGNLFVTDESNQAVYELTAASGYSTVITI